MARDKIKTLIARVWRPSGPSRAPWNIIARLCVCLSVCSLHKCMSFNQQFEAPRDVPLRPESRPVLFSGGRPLPASCYMLAGFTSRPVLSGLWSPTPCRLVRARVTSLHDCIVSMQALAFAGSFHFAKSGPPPIASLSRCSITGSRARAQQVEWCRCTAHVRDRLLFRVAALRPSEGPQRSALVVENSL